MGTSRRRSTPVLPLLLLLVALASLYVSSAAPLAAERTRRKDPLDGFRLYAGGWNISDRHYIASVAFSAAPVFAAAAVWLVAFALVSLVACCCRCCCGKTVSDYTYSRKTFTVSLLLVLAFTAAAVVGCADCGAVRRAGQAARQHDGDAALRCEPVGRRRGEPEGLRRVHRDDQGVRRHGRRVAARSREEGRPGRGQGERGGGRAQRAHRHQRAQDQDRAGHHKEDSHRCGSRDAGLGVSGACVLVGWAGDGRSLPGISGMDPCYCDIYLVGCFPPPAQRGRGHLRGHGGMGAPPTEQHGPRRHPPLRRRGGNHRRPAPEQGGEPAARLHAQRSALQRRQRQQRLLPGRPAALLQPVLPSGAAPLQPLPPRPLRPPLRRRRGPRRRRAPGVAALHVPRYGRAAWGIGNMCDGGPPHAGDVRAGAGRGERQRRAGRLRPGARRPGGLHVRAPDVRNSRRRQLPRAEEVQRQGVPGAARRGGGRDGGRGGVAGALQGEAAAARVHQVPGVAVQAAHRREVAAQEPEAAVQESREQRRRPHDEVDGRGMHVVVGRA